MEENVFHHLFIAGPGFEIVKFTIIFYIEFRKKIDSYILLKNKNKFSLKPLKTPCENVLNFL